MSTGNDGSPPRSMRHKRILDAAADHPTASVEELANHIPTATPELVERVLDEHGDPAATDESADAVDEPEDENSSSEENIDNETSVSSDDHQEKSVQTTAAEPDESESPNLPSKELTAKQRTVLEYVAMDPSATQREIADRLGVTAATVSNRVSGIDGFEWSERKSFVEELFVPSSSTENDQENVQDRSSTIQTTDGPRKEGESDPESTTATEPTSDSESSNEPAHQPDSADDHTEQHATESNADDRHLDDKSVATVEQLQALESRLNELESQIHDETERTGSGHSAENSHPVLDDPALLHKTVQLWLEDERFSEAEEAALLRTLFS